jgi:hypothetical protein
LNLENCFGFLTFEFQKLYPMQPFERFKKTNEEGNLWVYLLTIAKGQEIQNEEAARLVFESFGFLPGGFMTSRVLIRLKQQGMISGERFQGKKAFKTTKKGIGELDQMKIFCRDLLDKI